MLLVHFSEVSQQDYLRRFLNHSLSKIGSTTLVNPREKGKFGSSNHGHLRLVDRT